MRAPTPTPPAAGAAPPAVAESPPGAAPQGMPALYYALTTPQEQHCHQRLLAELEARQAQSGAAAGQNLLVEAEPASGGAWLYTLITQDWPEPGLLDKILEALLRCHTAEGGLRIRQARIFTGRGGQVINLLELCNRAGQALSPQAVEQLRSALGQLRQEERKLLQTLRYFPTRNFIPLLQALPELDHQASPDYTCMRVQVARMSHRFISVLLHFLARSSLWLSIQVAHFTQQENQALLQLYVVDQHKRKLADAPPVRKALLQTCEQLNAMLLGFNLHYIRRAWRTRDERCAGARMHSRPDPQELLSEIADITSLAAQQRIPQGLRGLAQAGLLSPQGLASIQQAQSFVQACGAELAALRQDGIPVQEEHVALCRRYLWLRGRARRTMEPLFDRLSHPARAEWRFAGHTQLQLLCQPLAAQPFSMDEHGRLCLQAARWLKSPLQAMHLFRIQARCQLALHPLLLEQTEDTWAGWQDAASPALRQAVGAAFLQTLDESVRCHTSALILRSMGQAGLLRRWLPGFAQIEGLIHRTPEHQYTVDEHSLMLVEALQGLALLERALPQGAQGLAEEYGKLHSAEQLLRFGHKHAIALALLGQLPALRLHPSCQALFRTLAEARETPLESLLETGFHERTHQACLGALHALHQLQRAHAPLLELTASLSHSEQRVLVLAGLLHDLKKPDRDHPRLGAEALSELLEATAIPLTAEETALLRWLIASHLELRPLQQRLQRLGQAGGPAEARRFAQAAGGLRRAQLLVLFTHADRMAVRFEPNRYIHDTAGLCALLRALE